MINFVPMTKAEVYDYLEQSYNPPALTEEFSEEEFFSEWHEVRDGLKEVLDQFGEYNAFVEGDYVISDSAALSRGINVEITSNALVTPDLVPTVIAFLKALPEKFEVEFDLETEESTHRLFVSQDGVKGHCSREILQMLLPDASVDS
jgi:hypothetical protein